MIYFLPAVEVQSLKLRSRTHSRTWPEPKSGNTLFLKENWGRGQGGSRRKKQTPVKLPETQCFVLAE